MNCLLNSHFLSFSFLAAASFLGTALTSLAQAGEEVKMISTLSLVRKFDLNSVRVRREGFREQVLDVVTLEFEAPDQLKGKTIEFAVSKDKREQWRKIGSQVTFSTSSLQRLVDAAKDPDHNQLFEGAMQKLSIAPPSITK